MWRDGSEATGEPRRGEQDALTRFENVQQDTFESAKDETGMWKRALVGWRVLRRAAGHTASTRQDRHNQTANGGEGEVQGDVESEQ